MSQFRVAALDAHTWPAFAALVEAHRGVWGGCWCMAFHPEGATGRNHSAEGNRAAKEARVRSGTAHAALVLDGDEAVGWCQFGPTAELPGIKHRRAYEAGLDALPDWRITCFFVGRGHRRAGVARTALRGALAEIGRLGGGVVEAYPEDVAGRRASGSFLWGGTVAMFVDEGFARGRQLGAHTWVLSRRVEPTAG